ncbi:MAG: hypothetical protein WCL60_02300 [Methylococcales bacterium]
MSVYDNTNKVFPDQVRTFKKMELSKETRAELLRRANILDANGDYLPQFFSADTISKDKKFRSSVI